MSIMLQIKFIVIVLKMMILMKVKFGILILNHYLSQRDFGMIRQLFIKIICLLYKMLEMKMTILLKVREEFCSLMDKNGLI